MKTKAPCNIRAIFEPENEDFYCKMSITVLFDVQNRYKYSIMSVLVSGVGYSLVKGI